MVTLSRLEEIRDLRTVWPHEALDFTPWLAQDENMALLSDAIEIDMTVDEIESCVGDFNVDIFASETGTDRTIIIENQLEDTDHDHLGKLITYASGKSADVIVWWPGLVLWTGCFEGCWLLLVVLCPLARVLVG